MRWKQEVEIEPYYGHGRTIEKFLFFPVCINGDCRWLERATILQECKYDKTSEGKFYRNMMWLD